MKYAAIAGAGVLLAGMFQMPSAPPMKLGLWESASTVTIAMPGLPGPRGPIVTKSRSCVTAETWAKAFTELGRASTCTRKNESYTGGHLSFDLVCPNINGTGHADMRFGDGAGHSTVHLEMNMSGHQATTDMVTESKFVSSSCGAVTPGKPEILH